MGTAQKMKFSSKDFFSKCDQIRSFLQIWSHLLKKSLMENFIFCVVEKHFLIKFQARSDNFYRIMKNRFPCIGFPKNCAKTFKATTYRAIIRERF